MRFLILVSVAVILAGFGCRENAVDSDGGSRPEFLTAEDVGVTDVYLRIKLPFSRTQQPVTLKRDTVTILRSVLTTPETLVVDERLLPNHTYTYTLISYVGSISASEVRLTITTMDTTSHNLTWDIDTLGDGNSSVLHDVAIINDTLAYAVGEIYKKDSLGQFETTPYNAARWNGKEWTLLRIQFRLDYGTSVIYSYTRITSVFAFSPDDIWFVQNVGGVTRFRYGQWVMLDFKLIDGPGGAYKIWGASSDNLYFVANNGRIVHYNGMSWEKVNSGTGSDIMDAWGIVNPKTGKTEVYCAVTSFWTPQDKKILKIINPGSVDTVGWGTGRDVVSIWTKKGYPMFTAGDGVFENRIGTTWQEMSIGANIYTDRIRGTDINDVFVTGGFGLISHYNGMNFKLVRLDMINGGGYGGLAVNDHLIIAVGGDVSRAIVAIGKR